MARSTPLLYRPPPAGPVLVAVVPAVLLLVLLLAAPVAYRAARMRVADVLRTE